MKYRVPIAIAGLCCLLWTSVDRASDPLVIVSGRGAQIPKQPQAVVAGDGVIHVTFGMGDAVHYCQSRDGGTTFEDSKQVFRVPNLSLGMRRGPRIAATQSAIVITAIGGRIGKGRDGDVLAWRSTDEGETWQGPVRVNDTADSAREGLHAMASGPDGSLWCVWLDLRDQKTEVYAAVSRDSGATWEANMCVYRSPDGSVCECCHPSVSVSSSRVDVMFRNSIAGDRDMYLVTSNDNGKTFAEHRKLGTGTWTLDACPMDGGMLSMGLEGTPQTVWRREGRVYLAAGDGVSEVLLGDGQQPWVAASSRGPFVVWTVGREGDLMCRFPDARQPVQLAKAARDPVVIAAPGGEGPVLAFWESKRDGESAVMAARLDAVK